MPQSASESLIRVLNEVSGAIGRVKAEEIEALGDAIVAAGGVFVAGEGRSGLVVRCLAMRLMQLGLRAHVAGETVTPAFGPGDLLVVVSGSGERRVTCTTAGVARDLGGRVAVVTAAPGSSLVRMADICVAIPVGESEQFGGSAFEQAALLVLDSLALLLHHRLGRSWDEMRSRHATLE